jgi:hypothetical protein
VSLPGGPGLAVTIAGSDVTIVPQAPLVPNASYVLAVGGLSDDAGNAADPVLVPFSIDPVPATVHLKASASLVTYGTTVTLRGTVVPHGAELTLDALLAGQTDPVTLGQLRASAGGAFALAVQPAASATYRASFVGDGHYLDATATVDVAVRPKLTLTAPKEFWRGETRTFRGKVAPTHSGGTVVVQRKIDGAWTDWRSAALDAASSYALRWKPTSCGVSRFRAVMAADAEHARAVTTAHRVVVDNPNPHHISMLYRHFIVVDLSECHLYYYERGRVVTVFDCVVGKPSTPTPVGQWTVYQKVVGMWGPYGPYTMWYHSPYHFGIHGTDEPWLLSMFPRHFSHGCTRLSNAHITWLFPRVPVGTPVRNIP